MIKKGVLLFTIIFLTFLAFMSYLRVSDNNKTINDLYEQKNILVAQYNKVNDEVNNFNTNVSKLEKEKETISLEINKVKSDIQTEKYRIAKEQAKNNINNNTGSKIAYITLDDGPSTYTSGILNILKKYNVKVTYFVNGKTDANSLNMYKRIVNEGHVIGNHIYSHKLTYIYSSVANFDYEFNHLQTLIKNTTGVTMNIFRFPGGSNTGYASGIINQVTSKYLGMGYQYFDWNVTAGDTSAYATNTTVYNNVISGCKSKTWAIILMHDSRGTTINTLESIIVALANQGFQFKTLNVTTKPIHFK